VSIPDRHKKALLSVAYLDAIAADAGVQFQPHNTSDYGVDGLLTRVIKNQLGILSPTGHNVQVQLKSTSNATVGNTHVSYAMAADAYNKLAVWEGPRCLLMLYVVPSEDTERTYFSESVGELRNCLYWHDVPSVPTPNSSSVTIQIPRTNLVDPQALIDLLEKRRLGHI